MYKNSRKIPGAYVWHSGVMKRITNQRLDTKDDVILNNRIRVSKKLLRLCKEGESIVYWNNEGLPDRCKTGEAFTISHFLDNDLVRLSDGDTTHYGYLKQANYLLLNNH